MKPITLRNKYEFRKDDNCIILYKIGKNNDTKSENYGKDVSKIIGYYSSIDNLLKKLQFLELIEAGTVNDLLQDLVSVNKMIRDLKTELTNV